jgi:TolB-like protein/Tfp pilus assembly protein PilF
MADDEQEHQSEKNRLLEEIRRRAEEEELKRLEEEDRAQRVESNKEEPPHEVDQPITSEPSSLPALDESALPPKPVRDQKVLVLKERLTIAIDRGKIEKAVDLMNELSVLVPDSAELKEFRQRLEKVQKEKQQSPDRKRTSTQRRAAPESSGSRENKAAQRKKVLELLDGANNDYEQEKYDRALQSVDSLLEVDPNNEDGQRLKQQIVKAQRIAELIKREEARSRAERASMRPVKDEVEPLPLPRGDQEVWGTSTSVQGPDLGLELPPEEKGPLAPPKRPLKVRLGTRLAKFRIPMKTMAIIAGILVLAAVGYVVFENVKNAVAPPLHSILVYPITPSQADSAAVWTADGLTDDLIADFSVVGSIRIIGAKTSFTLRGSTRDFIASAKSLGANYVLQTTLGRVGDQVAVQSSLYDTVKNRVIWTTTLQSSLRELPTARVELVRKALGVLEVTLTPEEDAALRRPQTSSSQSYDSYLHARSMLRNHDRYPPLAIVEMFQQAVRMDSFYVDAQAGLGWAYILAYEADRNGVDSYLTKARTSIQRALSLSQRDAEVFLVWGVTEQYAGQKLKAVERLEQAAGVAPSDPEVQRRLAVSYLSTGKNEFALKSALRAVADDPGCIESYTTAAQVQQFVGDYKSAYQNYDLGYRLAQDKSEYAATGLSDVLVFLQQHDRALDMLNDRLARVRTSYIDEYRLARVQQSAGRPKAEWFAALQKARSVIEERLKEDPRDVLANSWAALVLTRLGEFKEAGASLKQAQQLDPIDVDVLYNAARMYALQRDKTQAFEMLKRAVDRHYSLSRILDMDFYNLRSEAEFQRIVAR